MMKSWRENDVAKRKAAQSPKSVNYLGKRRAEMKNGGEVHMETGYGDWGGWGVQSYKFR